MFFPHALLQKLKGSRRICILLLYHSKSIYKKRDKLKTYNVAVVGATGLVGRTMIKVLEEHNFPVNILLPLASERSAGMYRNVPRERY